MKADAKGKHSGFIYILFEKLKIPRSDEGINVKAYDWKALLRNQQDWNKIPYTEF